MEVRICQSLGMSFAKPLFLKMGCSQSSKIVAFWTFYISVFVITTGMVVNTYTVMYVGMAVIIC